MAIINRIEDSFEDRKMTLLLGLSAWIYFFYHIAADKTATRVLPVMKPLWYGIVFLLVVAAQVAVWIYFKHFNEKKWNRRLIASVYFGCELGVLMFTVSMFLWPIYMMFRSKLI